jgi:predicted MPP superfamily phosphohydrolase
MKSVTLGWFLTYLHDMVEVSVVLIVQFVGALMLLHDSTVRSSRRLRTFILVATPLSLFAVIFGALLRFGRVNHYFPVVFWVWTRALSMGWALSSVFLVALFALLKLIPRPVDAVSPGRRKFLRVVRAAAVGAPAIAFGYGTFIERYDLRMREEWIRIPGLDPDLEGLRLAQLTDIHLSPFLSERVLERAVAMANETRPHLALVTGDLISLRGDPLDSCLDRLAGLRGDAGVFGCMGNHEIYSDVQDYVAERGAKLGIRFLRSATEPLKFGGATLNLAGVDYQRMHSRYLVGAEKMVRPAALNVLLSHNPDVFPVAARQGWQFTISGHTHGGQVNVEILRQDLNIARFFTPYTMGLYRIGASSIYVSRGIGTIGVPVRLGAPPEVALLRLCRT